MTLQHEPNRPTSIDLTLALERELDNESLPNSPNPPRPQSLDTHVLASIVTQLRLSLAEVTKERDTLSEQLAEAQTREGGLKEALEHVTDKCLRCENELEGAAAKRQEDEETISMLRTKVEESRRALMRLQTEKRMSAASNLTLDLSRPPPQHASLSGPPSSRRSSFQPLTGTSAGRTGHRRISSVSDSGVLANAYGDGQWPPPSPMSPDATPTERAPTQHNRRVSLLFGRGGAAQPESIGDIEVELLRKQMQLMQQQLDDTKRDLSEVQEAHEASELCVRALRTFIADNNVGIPAAIGTGTGKPSQPPTHSKQGSTASRWGFRLWNTEPEVPTPPQSGIASPASTPVQTAPSKFGGLFTGRKSTSSNSARPSYDPVHQEPMYNGSDTSSLPDSSGPISPASEVPHTSMGELGGDDMVRAKEQRAVVQPFEHTQEISVA
ncbi:uncharacterized protein TRAVEDRAFT_168455 [Trametes versicolor FP-101664 SS1]|uniref:uncharacterized protein n=1 Tax=Trametes versicolor (strain FP-101664) TaxID=717944 RepID=UPI00046220DC|nr:uncharacterized protein TRAVEDRAFT_168455 [Trametes versicolor FP-101664 SS1]EIW58724.1 hypothetical protein TRAVEDRAFT_168455 [Trametes versicolor FP-101664 SS1]